MTSRPSRSQLRRHARRLRRDGYQPMMLFNQGDQLPETAAVAIGRAIWRYRSELAPIAVARPHRGRGRDPPPQLTPNAWPWLAVGTGHEHGDTSRHRHPHGCGRLVRHRPARRARLRQRRDRAGRRMAHRGDRARPGHPADARDRCQSSPSLAASPGGPAAGAAPRSASSACSKPGQRSPTRSA